MITVNDLQEAVGKPEARYRWEKRSEQKREQGTVYELGLLSQVWRGIPWQHTVRIFVPPHSTFPETAVLYIVGPDGDIEDQLLGTRLAAETGCLCAFLYSVPNQPLFQDLMEDDLIAYTFSQFLETGDRTWPLLFPMVKSVIRAMDALQAFVRRAGIGQIQRFILRGASKRGWTAWLAAAADSRVNGLIPMVFDNLNVTAQMPHQIESWGNYSEQISEYTERDLPAKMSSELGQTLAQLIDPYTYRQHLTMAKLIINGANDRYWATDALNLYWDDLPPSKWVLYVPNSGHQLEASSRVFNTTVAFIRAIAVGMHLPLVTWNITQVGEKQLHFALSSDTSAIDARVWGVVGPNRDFRSATWQSMPLRDADIETEGHRRFVGQISIPASGYMAVFGEIEFQEGNRNYTLSTQMKLVGGK